MKPDKQSSFPHFPTRLLVLALVLTAAGTVWLAWKVCDLNRFVEVLSQPADVKLHSERIEVRVSLMITGIALAALLVAWFTVMRTLAHWRAAFQQAYDSQDMRVQERTAELQKTGLAVQASEARMRAITDSAQDAILMMDPEGRASYWNPAAERILGYTSAEALGQKLHELIAPARFHPAYQDAFPAFQLTGQGAAIGKTLDLEARRKDGQEISVQLSLSALQINGGWHAVGILRDTTDRKQVEEKLQQLSRAVEQSPASIVITDSAGNIEYANPKCVEVTGYALAEILGKNPRVLKSGEKSPEAYRELWETIAAGKEWRGEFHNKKKNGRLYWESASISPIRDLAGRITHYVAVKEDITERKQAEAERVQLIRELQAALANVKSLSGLLPICSGCKKIRDDTGYWNQVESYIQRHSEATFTHGLCPECIKKYYPDLEEPARPG
jgi:PAS domain S-box-containing protein